MTKGMLGSPHVTFGIASIRIGSGNDLCDPLAIMAAFGVGVLCGRPLSHRPTLYHNFWFERSLFVYGWNTGVIATSVTLLRVTDPCLRTKTQEDPPARGASAKRCHPFFMSRA